MSPDAPSSPDEDRAPPSLEPNRLLEQSFARQRWKRLLRIAAGVAFLVLGVIGLFLPVLQGVLFLAIGAALLAPDVPLARRALVAIYRRWPRVRRAVPERFRRLGRGERTIDVEVTSEPGVESDVESGGGEPR